jgi:hypothetical protein
VMPLRPSRRFSMPSEKAVARRVQPSRDVKQDKADGALTAVAAWTC